MFASSTDPGGMSHYKASIRVFSICNFGIKDTSQKYGNYNLDNSMQSIKTVKNPSSVFYVCMNLIMYPNPIDPCSIMY